MHTLDIRDNYNGKLFCDHFTHVCAYDQQLVNAGQIKLKHRGAEMGIITVKDLRILPFSRLSDMVSFIAMGKSVQYLANQLNRQNNGGKTLEPDADIMHIIFGYEQRNMEVQGPLLEDWWRSKNVNAEI